MRRYNLAGGWYLQRVEVNSAAEWVICDPNGDRLGNTAKHKAEFDAAMATIVSPEELMEALDQRYPGQKIVVTMPKKPIQEFVWDRQVTEDERHHLQEWAKRQLAIYLLHNPLTEQFYEDLLANADAWRMGFNEEEFYVWVTPMTVDERFFPMPFNVLKCDWHDFQAIRTARSK